MAKRKEVEELWGEAWVQRKEAFFKAYDWYMEMLYFVSPYYRGVVPTDNGKESNPGWEWKADEAQNPGVSEKKKLYWRGMMGELPEEQQKAFNLFSIRNFLKYGANWSITERRDKSQDFSSYWVYSLVGNYQDRQGDFMGSTGYLTVVDSIKKFWRDIFELGTGDDTPEIQNKCVVALFYYLYPRAMITRQLSRESLTRANIDDPSGKYLSPIAIDLDVLEKVYGGIRTPNTPKYAPINPGNSLWVKATNYALMRWYRTLHHTRDDEPDPPLVEFDPNDAKLTKFAPDSVDSWVRQERQLYYEIYIYVLYDIGLNPSDPNRIADMNRYQLWEFANREEKDKDWLNTVIIGNPNKTPINPLQELDLMPQAVSNWIDIATTPPYDTYNNAQRDEWLLTELERLWGEYYESEAYYKAYNDAKQREADALRPFKAYFPRDFIPYATYIYDWKDAPSNPNATPSEREARINDMTQNIFNAIRTGTPEEIARANALYIRPRDSSDDKIGEPYTIYKR